MVTEDQLTQRIDQLAYDFNRFDLTDFVQHIARLRRRDILVLPVSFAPELSAVWIRATTADYIFHNASTHAIHQTHSILHELAHIILGHRCYPVEQVLPPELLASLETNAAQGRLRKAAPHLRENREEQEAEALVFLIQKRLVVANRMRELMGPSSSIRPLRQWVDGMAFEG